MIDYSVHLIYTASMEKLGEAIRERRQSLKLTARDLANKVGIDPTYITYIEKHNKIPSPAVMEKIENILEDPMLSTIYLKTKYPDVCKKFERGQKDIAAEFMENAKKLIKKNMAPEEKNEVKKQLKIFKTELGKIANKFLGTIEKLEKMEKLL